MIEPMFIQGPIPAEKISDTIARHQSMTEIGAHSLFLGQVRADKAEGKAVTAIEYSAYEEMAGKELEKIREQIISQYDLISAHIYHSLGEVKTGQICFFVFTCSAHRREANEACRYLVDEIKEKVPIFGKELFEDETHQWKVNR